MNTFVCLTLIAPRSLRDELFDYLSGQTDLVSGFTASQAAGHGRDATLQTPAERVRGEAEEVLVRMILPEPDATRLLDRLKTAFAGSRLVYWLMPVTQFGLIDER